MLCSVQAGDGLALPTIRDALRALQVPLQQLSVADLAAHVDAAGPLAAEVAAAAADAAAADAGSGTGGARCVLLSAVRALQVAVSVTASQLTTWRHNTPLR